MFSSFKETKFDQPLRTSLESLASFNFKFYNPKLHKAAFAIPQFFYQVYTRLELFMVQFFITFAVKYV